MNRIKTVLKEQGRSQTWLSEKIGKSVVIVNSYCNNKSQPKLRVLYDIAEVLDVSVKDLLLEKKND
jgi:transcriptional regulator with XRE-family HTH domain